MATRKRGLGKGLDALLGASAGRAPRHDESSPVSGGEAVAPRVDGERRALPLDVIQRGKYQPRRDMDQASLQELAESIKAQGVMQPIIVRALTDERYEIIAGERRWRASQLAGLSEIPVIVREVGDDAAIAMALIENIQREDLNPIEEAYALQRLQREFDLTQQEVATAVGKSRTTITNLLRLTTLQADVRRMLEHGDLEMGHARALLGLESDRQTQAARQVVAKGLSVRQTEALVRSLSNPVAGANRTAPGVDPNIRHLQNDLARKVGAKVEIKHASSGRGKLIFSYNSLDELDGILHRIK